EALPVHDLAAAVLAQGGAVELLVGHGGVAADVDVAQGGGCEQGTTRIHHGGQVVAALFQPAVPVGIEGTEAQPPGIGVALATPVHPHESVSEEVRRCCVPVTRHEGLYVPAHEHVPNFVPFGAVREGVRGGHRVLRVNELLYSAVVSPASTSRLWPVMLRAASESRKATVSPQSRASTT